MPSPDPYLVDLVRKADPDRYLATLYTPEAKRQALLALDAFDGEIARVRDLVSDPMPGEIRLQWWRDVLDADEPDGEGHPIAGPLVRAIADHGLPRKTLLAYLEARTFDLYDDPMPNRTDLEGYCGETVSAMLHLAALVLDPAAAMKSADLSGHAGCAMGILRLIQLMPRHRARGQCYVPAEVLAAAGLDRDSYVAGSDTQAMARAVAAMVSLASEHLRTFRSAAPGLAPTLRPAFLPVAVGAAHLRRVDPETAWRQPAAEMFLLRRHWILFRHAGRGWPAL
jgi:phytoene synthase